MQQNPTRQQVSGLTETGNYMYHVCVLRDCNTVEVITNRQSALCIS